MPALALMPHVPYPVWPAELVWLRGISDSLMAAAYFSIPFSIYYFARRRPDLKLRWVILMFAAFILAAGAMHVMSVWNIWHSNFALAGVVNAVTAILSVATAVIVATHLPAALKIASPEQLEAINQVLNKEIESRKTAEARLRQMLESQYIASEARLHTYFETASQAIIVMSADLHMRLVNHRTEEMFGYSRAELIGKSVEILWPERVREEYVRTRRREFAGCVHQAVQARVYCRKDASEFPAELALSFVDTADGPLAFTMVTDITERIRAAEELARVNQQLRSYLEAASQAIVAVSPDGRIQLVNRRMEEMFGYTRIELLGRELNSLLPRRFRERHAGHQLSFFNEPRLRPMGPGLELAGLRKNGSEFPVEIGLSFVDTENGRLAMGLISDITERKEAADQLARAHQELLRSNEELEQFAYIASHNLQEPLRMITGYLNLLERRYRDQLDGDAREFIHFAVNGASRMKDLIKDLLSVSRIHRQELNKQQYSSAAMLRDAVQNLKVAIEECGASVTSDDLPQVRADGALLTQVFQNLIGNALKFRQGDPRIHVSARRDGLHWIFSVRDNGIGIEPQHAERIFRIFERLNEPGKYEGTGIGLAITQRIVSRHGGRIWVESQKGAGSTFFFSISADGKSLISG